MKYCENCGHEILEDCVICPHCGCQAGKMKHSISIDTKNKAIALLLCFFLGGFGAHRFYVGDKTGGATMLVLSLVGYATSWLFIGIIPLVVVGIWIIVDFIEILVRKDFCNVELHW